MLPEVARWFAARTSTAADWPVGRLLDAKAAGSQSGAVVLPALDEEETVGRIVDVIRRQLVDRHPLVDELLVVDSGSTDATVKVALEAGARVIAREDVLPDIAPVPGKGEVLWRGVAATTSEVVAFVDSDLRDFTPAFGTGLLGPLLCEPDVHFVKATYDRAITVGGVDHISGGGRVTELVARPLIALHWPALAGFVQPLGGEYAARRALLERLPFACGYGVELGLLIDALDAVGLDALAQVDLARRKHRNSDVAKLGRMAAEILQVAEKRLGRETPAPLLFAQYARTAGGYSAVITDVTESERPPLSTLPAYRQTARPV